MKKLIALILALAMAFALCACGASGSSSAASTSARVSARSFGSFVLNTITKTQISMKAATVSMIGTKEAYTIPPDSVFVLLTRNIMATVLKMPPR